MLADDSYTEETRRLDRLAGWRPRLAAGPTAPVGAEWKHDAHAAARRKRPSRPRSLPGGP
jgi:hypothetical protein